MHFAAKFGLQELTSRLTDLPDAVLAHSILNSDRKMPEQLARANKHSSLTTFLENFREVVSVLLKFVSLFIPSHAMDMVKMILQQGTTDNIDGIKDLLHLFYYKSHQLQLDFIMHWKPMDKEFIVIDGEVRPCTWFLCVETTWRQSSTKQLNHLFVCLELQ